MQKAFDFVLYPFEDGSTGEPTAFKKPSIFMNDLIEKGWIINEYTIYASGSRLLVLAHKNDEAGK